jgi:hypothetical protein
MGTSMLLFSVFSLFGLGLDDKDHPKLHDDNLLEPEALYVTSLMFIFAYDITWP